MSNIIVTVDAARIKNLQRNLKGLPDYVRRAGMEAVAAQMESDKRTITPGRVKYPIQWTSEKQRRAYFATDGFGAGIPYRRTGKLVDSIHFQYGKGGGSEYVTMTTESPYEFVMGQHQQKFHHNTGWRAVETWMTSQRRKVLGVFNAAVKKAMAEFNRFMYGGAPGI